MKKLFLLTAVLLLVFKFSNAQTSQGNQNLGANLGLFYSDNTNYQVQPYNQTAAFVHTKIKDFSAGPAYSYFVANNLDIAVALSFESDLETNDEINAPMRQLQRNYAASVFLRKYVMYKNIGFRAGPYIGYENQNQQYIYSGSNSIYSLNSKANEYYGGISMDLVYYPSKILGVSLHLANLTYQHSNINNTTQGNEKEDSVNFNFISNGLGLSVFYVFGS